MVLIVRCCNGRKVAIRVIRGTRSAMPIRIALLTTVWRTLLGNRIVRVYVFLRTRGSITTGLTKEFRVHIPRTLLWMVIVILPSLLRIFLF